jgi:hypothetical protein
MSANDTGRTSSWSFASSTIQASGSRSRRVEAICPSLTNDGPRSIATSRTRSAVEIFCRSASPRASSSSGTMAAWISSPAGSTAPLGSASAASRPRATLPAGPARPRARVSPSRPATSAKPCRASTTEISRRRLMSRTAPSSETIEPEPTRAGRTVPATIPPRTPRPPTARAPASRGRAPRAALRSSRSATSASSTRRAARRRAARG